MHIRMPNKTKMAKISLRLRAPLVPVGQGVHLEGPMGSKGSPTTGSKGFNGVGLLGISGSRDRPTWSQGVKG